MAIANIHSIKSTLGKAIDYITNIKKTLSLDGTRLVSSFGCATETAAIEFTLTANFAKAVVGDYTKTGGADVKAYHLVQSFDVSDKEKMSPEQMHDLGKEFAEKFLQGKYEYVIATHVDKKHIHNHIIFNATSFVDYKKFRSQPFKTVAKIREVSDRICRENGLSVLPSVGIGESYKESARVAVSYKEWLLKKEGKLSWRETIKLTIDEVIPRVNSFDEFIEVMKSSGIDVKQGKNIGFLCLGTEQERYMRGNNIEKKTGRYTKEGIIRRIATERCAVTSITIDKSKINKTLTDGFLLTVPGKDYLLYLNGATAQLENENIIVTLRDSDYNIFNLNMSSAGKITAEEVLLSYGIEPVEVPEFGTNDDAIPLSEYLRIRQTDRKERLHQVASAVLHSRKENVIYYSDFTARLDELHELEYNTRHTIIDLEKTEDSIKGIGKLLITYQKYLPVMQDYEKRKNTKFARQKFENKHQLELASFDYAERTLKEMGVDPNVVSFEDLKSELKQIHSSVEGWNQQLSAISERIDKLEESKEIIENFIGSRDEVEKAMERAVEKKNNVELS